MDEPAAAQHVNWNHIYFSNQQYLRHSFSHPHVCSPLSLYVKSTKTFKCLQSLNLFYRKFH